MESTIKYHIPCLRTSTYFVRCILATNERNLIVCLSVSRKDLRNWKVNSKFSLSQKKLSQLNIFNSKLFKLLYNQLVRLWICEKEVSCICNLYSCFVGSSHTTHAFLCFKQIIREIEPYIKYKFSHSQILLDLSCTPFQQCQNKT